MIEIIVIEIISEVELQVFMRALDSIVNRIFPKNSISYNELIQYSYYDSRIMKLFIKLLIDKQLVYKEKGQIFLAFSKVKHFKLRLTF